MKQSELKSIENSGRSTGSDSCKCDKSN